MHFGSGNVSLNDETDQSKRTKQYRTVSNIHQTAFFRLSGSACQHTMHATMGLLSLFYFISKLLDNDIYYFVGISPICDLRRCLPTKRNIAKLLKTIVFPPSFCLLNEQCFGAKQDGKMTRDECPQPCNASFSYSRPRCVVQT